MLCVYSILFSIRHLSVGAWVASTFQLLEITLLLTRVSTFLFESLLSVLLGIFPEVGLLKPMVTLRVSISRIAVLFFTAAPFCIPTSSLQGSWFLYNSIHCFLLPPPPVFTSPVINEWDRALFHVLVTVRIIFFRGMPIHIPSPVLKWFFKFFCYWVVPHCLYACGFGLSCNTCQSLACIGIGCMCPCLLGKVRA